ncbi:LppA family lipoprotein [Cellulomonas sp. NPDC089187]|uniref:LppA family lipoprotein n=1 Tax=Cellulomonas sp. NPDC089187 TaxID=3154970 RepID=UPI003423D523
MTGPMEPPTRSPRTKRTTAALLCLILSLAGCGAVCDAVDPNPPPEYLKPPLEQRPTMETVIADLRQMRAEIIAAFNAEFGTTNWHDDNPTAPSRRSGCTEVDRVDGMGQLSLPLLIVERSFHGAERERAIEIVQQIGARHGFKTAHTIVNQEQNFSIYAQDQYGTSYDFGGNVHSSISMSTGCFLWETPPDETWTYAPDAPSS